MQSIRFIFIRGLVSIICLVCMFEISRLSFQLATLVELSGVR